MKLKSNNQSATYECPSILRAESDSSVGKVFVGGALLIGEIDHGF